MIKIWTRIYIFIFNVVTLFYTLPVYVAFSHLPSGTRGSPGWQLGPSLPSGRAPRLLPEMPRQQGLQDAT